MSYFSGAPKTWRLDLPTTMGMAECALATLLTALEEEALGQRKHVQIITAASLQAYLTSN